MTQSKDATLKKKVKSLTAQEMLDKYPNMHGPEWKAWEGLKREEAVHLKRLRRQPPSRPKPTFNKESYLTDSTYSLPITDLSSVTRKNLKLITQYYDIDWDDEAFAIPVQYQADWIETFKSRSRRGSPPSPGTIYRKSYMIEGTTPLGSEVLYFRKEGQHPASGQTYVYVNGVRYLVTEFIKNPRKRREPLLTEETELYTQEKFRSDPPKKIISPALKDSHVPEPEEIYSAVQLPDKSLDWK